MDFKENIANTLNKVKASNELDKKIFDSTINKQNSKLFVLQKPFFRKQTALIIVIAFFSVITIVAASEYVQRYILNKTIDEDGWFKQTVELSEPVIIDQNNNVTCDNITNLQDLEEKLGIEFAFNPEEYNSQINKCDIRYNETGEIESVEVSVFGFYNFDDYNKKIDSNYKEDITNPNFMERNEKLKILDVSIAFITPFASQETKEELKSKLGRVTSNYEPENTEFYLPNINTYGYYNIFPTKNIPLSKNAIFVYNNIFYNFSGNRPITIEEILKILNKF